MIVPTNCPLCSGKLIRQDIAQIFFLDCESNDCITFSFSTKDTINNYFGVYFRNSELRFNFYPNIKVLHINKGENSSNMPLPDFDYSDWAGILHKLELYKPFL